MTDLSSALRLNALDCRIVGRAESLFADDLRAEAAALEEQIRGSRILVIGGAGSIGSQTLKTILRFAPKTVHVIDHNENGLAELVRDLRSSPEPVLAENLLTLPFDYAGAPFRLWFAAQEDYDYVLNFAALKHVRSEKDPYSILAMLDTNVLKLVGLSQLLADRGGLKRLFCVSTDKAANPSSMMGATKRLMEHALFSPAIGWRQGLAITSARFANVALSNGSLLQSWQHRLAARQPMACPEGCRRFFVALPESGHLCTLAGLGGEDGNIHVPALNPDDHLQLLEDVAVWFLEEHGLVPFFTRDEDEALSNVDALAAQGKWPVLLTPLDTAGEKPYEEFVAKNETLMETRFSKLHRVPYLAPGDPEAFPTFLARLREIGGGSGAQRLTVDHLKSLIAEVEEDFAHSHVVSTKSLDQRM
ncbi:polysaccharide biosynthesis protein [Rhodovulum imhoffii]|uniref:Polysaccharide biosynthesis protein n=1 Tax=Rhodovulum imhoffii TaxID=365340 RepID=A0A2T5BTY3_9RHOB|nr:polysaccharide biosynthesis protein [Rhodovulum imhoffii]MBK5932727.1 hypothetical protein [Rhodovulum imhoffii]PTN02933.1 polysaccharide biosynthesis protein [Rhodovulum imhoffii]